MKRRDFLIGAGALCFIRKALASSERPVIFWFYTSEQMGLHNAPVDSSQFEIVSADLPCHGEDVRPGEPPELAGWRHRIDRGEDLLAPLINKCRYKLDGLIKSGAANPSKVFVGGVSRGAWAAFQLSVADARFKNVLGLSPVVDLMALTEFAGCTKAPPALSQRADLLAMRSIFLSIQSRDDRVGTTATVNLVSAIVDGKHDAEITLAIERGGQHTVSDGAIDAAKQWIERRLV
jgi:predicted esterase